jgi:hypothetical protein
MAKLNIPERYRTGVSAIRKLDKESVRAVRAALDRTLEATPPGGADGVEIPRDPRGMAVTAVRSVPGVDRTELRSIAEALAGLYAAKAVQDVSVEEFADKVCDAMESLASDELRLSQSEHGQFRENLIELLSADVFTIVSKVQDLATEDEHTFCQARIVTDLRPVFGTRVEDGPRAMVVVHLLKLAYHQGSEAHHQFYVALDEKDLQSLKKVIERAESKAKTLRSVIGNVRLFGVRKE